MFFTKFNYSNRRMINLFHTIGHKHFNNLKKYLKNYECNIN